MPDLRIGDRVRCTVGDRFITAGTEGKIRNVRLARFNQPAGAWVHWDDDCESLISIADFEVLPREAA